LTAGKYDKTARLWDAETSQLIFPPMRHTGIVWDAVFDPAERRILTYSSDLSAARWDARTGERIDPPMRHDRGLTRGTYDGSGQLIATSSIDQTVRLWSAETGELLAAPFRHADACHSAELTKDGRRLLTSSTEGRVQVWELTSTDWPVNELKRYAEVLSTQRLNADGRPATISVAEMVSRVAELRRARPHDFEISADQLQRWHRREKIDSQRAGNDFAARFHARHTTLPDSD
jgi:WD40 repeat protein